MMDDFAGVDIAGLDNEWLDIDGLDSGGQDTDGLNIAALDIVGLDNDGQICGQLTELELLNSIFETIFTPFLFLKHTRCLLLLI